MAFWMVWNEQITEGDTSLMWSSERPFTAPDTAHNTCCSDIFKYLDNSRALTETTFITATLSLLHNVLGLKYFKHIF